METHPPPIRVIVPGTCYRYEATDATHEWMLTQIEGLVIDEGVSFAHLKGTLESFVHRMFGPDVETRFRCDYFPFVEPGAELGIRWGNRWLEMLGAGMVHPENHRAGPGLIPIATRASLSGWASSASRCCATASMTFATSTRTISASWSSSARRDA